MADELRNRTESNTPSRPFFFRKVHGVEKYDENHVENSENVESQPASEMDAHIVSECNAISSKPPFRYLNPKNYGRANETTVGKGPQRTSEERQENHSVSRVRPRACYNCKSESHRFYDCDSPISRVFCFRCGRENVLSPNCICKHSKNFQAVAYYEVVASDEELCH